MKDAGRIAVGI